MMMITHAVVRVDAEDQRAAFCERIGFTDKFQCCTGVGRKDNGIIGRGVKEG